MLKKTKRIQSINTLILDYLDELLLLGVIELKNEKEFVKNTKLFLGEITNFHIESMTIVKEEIEKNIDDLEAFERILN